MALPKRQTFHSLTLRALLGAAASCGADAAHVTATTVAVGGGTACHTEWWLQLETSLTA
jgi:hypothetical protein